MILATNSNSIIVAVAVSCCVIAILIVTVVVYIYKTRKKDDYAVYLRPLSNYVVSFLSKYNMMVKNGLIETGCSPEAKGAYPHSSDFSINDFRI